tara:strand:- start:5859 stop:6170 length:312 start_codon:yes stop_codon:yes gene_type:complete
MIQATEPMIYENSEGSVVMQVTTTIENGAKTLSLSCDNSVGRLKSLSRSDIRLMMKFPDSPGVTRDVTGAVFGTGEHDVVPATVQSMNTAMLWLNRVAWGFDR